MTRRLKILFLLALAMNTFVPRNVMAMDRNLRSVLIGGGYGLLGGAVVGLVSYPMTRDARSIFIGASVGLYLGLVVGFYNAVERDNPGNPFRSEADLPSSRPDLAAVAPRAIQGGETGSPPAWLEVEVPVVRF